MKRSVRPIVLDVLSIHADDLQPAPVDQAVVDCAIYVDGGRLAGDCTYATALPRVRQLNEEGRQAYVWLGLREPTDQQMASVADTFGCSCGG